VAFATTNVRFRYVPVCFAAESFYSHFPLQKRERSFYKAFQNHILTGVSLQDCRNWTGKTQLTLPRLSGSLQQTAFFFIPTTVIVSIKEITFLTSRCLHINLGDEIEKVFKQVWGIKQSDSVR
jgi:hypothetical protein